MNKETNNTGVSTISAQEDKFNKEIKKLLTEHHNFEDKFSKHFRNLINKLNVEILLPRINTTNSLLEDIEGEVAPQILCFTNIDDKQLNIDRYFIQIVISEASKNLDLLSDPYLLIEAFVKDKTLHIFWSDLNDQHLHTTLSTDNPNLEADFAEKFSSVFLNFLENNLSSANIYANSEFA